MMMMLVVGLQIFCTHTIHYCFGVGDATSQKLRRVLLRLQYIGVALE